MLFEFKSRATGSIVMTDPVGRQMLEAIGRPVSAQGVITIEQLPEAIVALKCAITAEREAIARTVSGPATPDDKREADELDFGSLPLVRFEQRALPLIEMLERSLAAGRDVTWGV
jgi:cyclopropane-fatty-acyl-phospholipid synthase